MDIEFALDMFRGLTGDVTPTLLQAYAQGQQPVEPFQSYDVKELEGRLKVFRQLRRTPKFRQRLCENTPEEGFYIATLRGVPDVTRSPFEATIHVICLASKRFILLESRGFSFFARQEGEGELQTLTIYDWCTHSSDFSLLVERNDYELSVERLGAIAPFGLPNRSLSDAWYQDGINRLVVSLEELQPVENMMLFKGNSVLQYDDNHAYALWLGDQFLVVVISSSGSTILEVKQGKATTLAATTDQPWIILDGRTGFSFFDVTIPPVLDL